MTWLEELDEKIRATWSVGESFLTEDVYQMEGWFMNRHPENTHVREKLRQLLQQLRDDEIIEFTDNAGTYRRLK